MSSDPNFTASQPAKSQRVLACVLCQQRKVKCDRQFPCANCVRSSVQCMPAKLAPRQRRRRFPERILLDRLRKYEELLRQNKIPFEPLHKDSSKERETRNEESGNDSDDENPEAGEPGSSAFSTTSKSERDTEVKSIWHAMGRGVPDPYEGESDHSHDEIREHTVRKAWEESVEEDDHLFFGLRRKAVDLSSLHPDPIQIFRLWQIYLDNVNPLLKVTHTPTLQGRIIEAASHVTSIDDTLEALMFSVYCVSILSLTTEDCQTIFNSPREDLLTRYQLACQQALFNCGFLRTSDRDCLTALYLYLLSVGSSTATSTVPQTLSSVLAMAIRIAQHMGIHNESSLTKYSVLEAEMRRRLWWSLMLFDTRMSELASTKPMSLNPIWDCKIPLNVNDSDLRSEMKDVPAVQSNLSEAVFITVRGEIADFTRNSSFYLDFCSPVLKPIAKYCQNGPPLDGEDLNKLEKFIEDRYSKHCDQDNPIHFMTIWTTKTYIAKSRLLQHHAKFSSPSMHQTEAQRDAATSHALKMLEFDTKIMTSPLTKRFIWLNRFYFPFLGYLQITQDLKKRPNNEQFPEAWDIMSDNYEAWFGTEIMDSGPVFKIFCKIILQAWKACEKASTELGTTLTPPKLVSSVKYSLTQITGHTPSTATEQTSDTMDVGIDDFQIPMPTEFDNQNLSYEMGTQDNFGMMGPGLYSGIPWQVPPDRSLHPFNWGTLGGRGAWPGWHR